MNISRSEECGNFFREIIDKLDRCPFMNLLLPWGPMAITCNSKPTDSDDGPIFWARPGEQLLRTDETYSSASSTAKMASSASREEGRRKSATMKSRNVVPPIRSLERREVLFGMDGIGQ